MIAITGAGSEMQGVGRLSDGRACFVPFAIPGEKVEIEIVNARDRFVNARLISVLEASEDRIEPLCPHFGVCGGCQAQHMTYTRALQMKRDRVYDALKRLGGIGDPLVFNTIPSEKTLAYRNKAEFAFKGNYAGAFQAGSHRVIDIDACPLQTDDANAVFRFIKENRENLPIAYVVPRVNAKGEMLLTISLEKPADLAPLANKLMKEFPFLLSVHVCRLNNRPAHALDGACRRIAGTGEFIETLCGLEFSVSPRSFFQVNHKQAEKLYETALTFADLKETDLVADIYCGAGTISLAAAKKCAFVTGIEIVEDAVRDAEKNAERNNLSNKTHFYAGDAAEVYGKIYKKQRFDCVIVDPPRKGMDEKVVNALLAAPPERVVYVSCNPATLARDVKLLTANGVFKFEKAVPVDMFPMTEHVETVILLSRNDVHERIKFDLNIEELNRTSQSK